MVARDADGLLRGKQSNRCVDVPALSQTNGTMPTLYSCNGGGNQAWTSTTTNQLSVYGTKCLAPVGDSTASGAGVEINDCDAGSAQQWNIKADGTVVGSASRKCLDVAAGEDDGKRDSVPVDDQVVLGAGAGAVDG
ncbi:RICIN domain-containing protein [Streptomyces sp. NBC_01497]|uniref:RICIN domain-containing protein n=1 Tax=Streptomyces sp. NBC_01497 TaxID=2903885 RepID=UPI002E365EF2|nr:RICIN domain-containing protein [Streptomyces sp. NBC_01497]